MSLKDVGADCLVTSLDFFCFFFREMFPSHVKLYVQNDAVAAMASGTMGKLHGCVLVSGTGTISYGFADGKEARAAGAGPILGDWGRYVQSADIFYALAI